MASEIRATTMNQQTVFQSEVTVNLENGLHLVPCSRIAELARNYTCDVQILMNERRVDAKTIFDLMTLGAAQGTHLIIEAKGESADEVIKRLTRLFETNFELEEGHDDSHPSG